MENCKEHNWDRQQLHSEDHIYIGDHPVVPIWSIRPFDAVNNKWLRIVGVRCIYKRYKRPAIYLYPNIQLSISVMIWFSIDLPFYGPSSLIVF